MKKTCTRCKETKPSTSKYFYKHKTGKDGLKSQCKVCKIKQQKEYQKKYPEAHAKAMKQWHRRLKKELIDYYGGKCACCGETAFEFMSLDHINGGGNAERKRLKKSGHTYYGWVKKHKPTWLQVLCHNCNLAKGFFGYCPHQSSSDVPPLNME